MTLHKANMSDLLKHVKAAVANHTVNTSLTNRKVNTWRHGHMTGPPSRIIIDYGIGMVNCKIYSNGCDDH